MKQVIVGRGEIGIPIYNTLLQAHNVWARDIEDPTDFPESFDVVHICFPYSETFVEDVRDYVVQYIPAESPQHAVVIHSTVVPGTTDAIAEECAHAYKIAYSPVKGRHRWMEDDLEWYPKYIAEATSGAYDVVAPIFLRVGMDTIKFPSVAGLELAKLLETTYSALLIAWAQEMERYCEKVEAEYLDVATFWYKVGYLPPVVHQPGFIGGHCLIPNLHLLDRVMPSRFVDEILVSNERFVRDHPDFDPDERLRPVNSSRNLAARGLPFAPEYNREEAGDADE